MKRSEMVEIINKKLISCTYGYVECNLKSFKEVADILLDEIEYQGMLPPKSLDTTCLKKGLVRGYTMMFEWDDENESND